MDLDSELVLTRNLFLQPLGRHSYAARASFASDRGVQLDAGTMALLSCFTEPCTPRAARAALGDTVAVTDADLVATIGELVGHGLLHDVAAPPAARGPVAGSGYAHALTHHAMLLDATRVDAYRLAIARLAPGRRVLEIGAGTGVLSIHAARCGAASVVALEESGVIHLARALAQHNGVHDQIEFIASNSMNYRPEQRAQLIIHELFGHEPFAEHALRYLEDARRRLLEIGGRWIPSAIEVRCRAIGRAGWTDRSRMSREAEEIGRRYGVDLGPYITALGQTPALPTFVRDADPIPAGAMTEDVSLYRVEFTKPLPEQRLAEPVHGTMTVTRGGTVNALVTHFRARMAEGLWLSNAPEAPRTHWSLAVYDLLEPRQVEAGQQLCVRARLEPMDGIERMLVELVDP